MITLISIYQIKRGPIHKRLRAKIKIENKIHSVWCGKQVGENSIYMIDTERNLVQMKTPNAIIQFGSYK